MLGSASPETSSSPADMDRVVHEPARLMIMAYLYVVDAADLTFLLRQTGLTWGNLSAHIARLEQAGYVDVRKQFVGKKPNSMVSLTETGREAFRGYRDSMQRFLGGVHD
jgi:DNA-binding MarR family transcriptional regulator